MKELTLLQSLDHHVQASIFFAMVGNKSVRTHLALKDLLPPAGYAGPATPSPPLGAFGLLLDESTPEVVGRILGRSHPAAEGRWRHLAGDVAACEAIKTSVVLQHIAPLPESVR